MPRNDPIDLQPPIKYKTWPAARPLTNGVIEAAADRAEARAMRIQLDSNSPNSSPTWSGSHRPQSQN
jgi:hypothetical protein